MHGFFRPCRAALLLGALAVAALAAGCQKVVKQDSATGEDGKSTGAVVLPLENNEAVGRGIVTYPGGDRVDWRLLELPTDAAGDLEITLTWKPPRPKLRLGFDLWDEWGKQLGTFEGKKNSSKYKVTGTLAGARGKTFVRVYAVGRGDAGTYKLELTYAPSLSVDPSKVPLPPKLAAVPKSSAPCDPFNFDRKNAACQTVCPAAFDPSWPGCQGKCPTPPDPNNPACQATMACPNPPDRRIKACPKSAWPKCNLAAKDPQNPNCDDAKADPVRGRVVSVQSNSDGIVLTINRGQNNGVEVGWSGAVLGDDGQPLRGGTFKITKVSKTQSWGKVRLTSDTVNANPNVELAPP